jgi:hypothetical protein
MHATRESSGCYYFAIIPLRKKHEKKMKFLATSLPTKILIKLEASAQTRYHIIIMRQADGLAAGVEATRTSARSQKHEKRIRRSSPLSTTRQRDRVFDATGTCTSPSRAESYVQLPPPPACRRRKCTILVRSGIV